MQKLVMRFILVRYFCNAYEDYDLADGVLKIVVTAKDQIVVNKHNAIS